MRIRFNLKYLSEDTDRHGNVRLYFRKRGVRKLRLASPLGSPAFWADYDAALRGETPPSHLEKVPLPAPKPRHPDAKSFRWLIDTYAASRAFKALDPRTQKVREGLLLRLANLHGDKPFALLEARHVRRIRDDHADRPGTANAFIKALRQLYRYALEEELASTNPAADVRYLRPARPGGFTTWTMTEIEKFETTHPIGSQARLAMALLFYLDLRRADAIRIGPQHRRNGRFEFTQHKNRNKNPVRISVPTPAALAVIIDATPIGDLTYLITTFGKPFTDNGFGNRFRKWCDAAGLEGYSAHGLRKARLTLGAELGLTPHHLQSCSGHRTLKETERYTREADQKRLADEAMARFNEADLARLNLKSVPPRQVVQKSGTLSSRK